MVRFAALISAMLFISGCGDSSASKAPPAPSLQVGGTAELIAGSQRIMAFPVYSDMDEAMTFIEASDDIGLDRMVAQGRVLICERKTKVRLIEHGFLACRVRILEGDHTGSDGWVTREFVRPESKINVNNWGAADTPKKSRRSKPPKKEKVIIDADTVSQRQLKLAKSLLDSNPDAARRRLQEIVDLFPQTDAGKEAAELLEKQKPPHF